MFIVIQGMENLKLTKDKIDAKIGMRLTSAMSADRAALGPAEKYRAADEINPDTHAVALID